MKKSLIWLVGASNMAEDYARVLIAQKKNFEVIGRGKKSALKFHKNIGKFVKTGGLNINLKKYNAPEIAIVAVGIEDLAKATKDLINAGTKKILLEKPGGLNIKEIRSLNLLANKKKAKVFIAYNRRFYQSVKKMKKLINRDGKILSVNFEFTEWSHKILSKRRNIKVLKNWLIGNSSHVIDLVFHLCGKPKKWNSWHSGRLKWHPNSARFSGSGITSKGIMFSYLSDWQAPGRWGLEFNTKRHKFILRPVEDLKIVKLGSTLVKNIRINNKLDQKFKPGIYLQLKSFLKNDFTLFCTLSEQVEDVRIYSKIAGYL